MDRERQIANLEYQISKIDGHTLFYNIGNRVYGLLGLAMAAAGTSASPGMLPISIPFAAEMVGDIITGKHHFISYRLLKIHPKYELERILQEQ